jgi:nitrate/TMAO reductase-like tetraheme cytochrome c subunit
MKKNHAETRDPSPRRIVPSGRGGWLFCTLLAMLVQAGALMAQSGASPSSPGSTPGLAPPSTPAPLSAAQAASADKPTDQQVAEENRSCLRCHGMATLGYRDAETGEIVSLVVDKQLFGHSVHGDLACGKCHEDGYQRYPHPEEFSVVDLNCVTCHEDHPENTDRLDFSLIEEEYQASIHAMSDDPEAEGFSCHSCHDPHVFRASLLGREIPEIVAYDNQLCMSCHDDVRDPLTLSHSWLPNPGKHWKAVRCIDCHTPLNEDSTRPVSHQILSAEQSNVNCVNCHTQGQGLMARLYEYRSQQGIESRGFFAQAVFNDAYVVGMSRNPLIDRLALIIIGLTILVLAGHGYGRYRAYRALQEQKAAAANAPAKEGDKQ